MTFYLSLAMAPSGQKKEPRQLTDWDFEQQKTQVFWTWVKELFFKKAQQHRVLNSVVVVAVLNFCKYMASSPALSTLAWLFSEDQYANLNFFAGRNLSFSNIKRCGRLLPARCHWALRSEKIRLNSKASSYFWMRIHRISDEIKDVLSREYCVILTDNEAALAPTQGGFLSCVEATLVENG